MTSNAVRINLIEHTYGYYNEQQNAEQPPMLPIINSLGCISPCLTDNHQLHDGSVHNSAHSGEDFEIKIACSNSNRNYR